jgi:hypothetical protein
MRGFRAFAAWRPAWLLLRKNKFIRIADRFAALALNEIEGFACGVRAPWTLTPRRTMNSNPARRGLPLEYLQEGLGVCTFFRKLEFGQKTKRRRQTVAKLKLRRNLAR